MLSARHNELREGRSVHRKSPAPGRNQATDDMARRRNGNTVVVRESGVDATAAKRVTAPRSSSAPAADISVEPVVTTSSTTRTHRPSRPGRATNSGASSRRSARLRPVWVDDDSRSRSRRDGTPSWRATARANNSPWSKPRSRRRRPLVGAQVTRSIPWWARCATSRLTIRPARCRPTDRRFRYLRPSTMLRARPVKGTAAITPCR